jgi:hypothetical protein
MSSSDGAPPRMASASAARIVFEPRTGITAGLSAVTALYAPGLAGPGSGGLSVGSTDTKTFFCR